MELLAVPKSVMPRVANARPDARVNAGSESRARKEDNKALSEQDQIKSRQERDSVQQRRQQYTSNEARDKGVAGLTRLAKRLKLDRESATQRERSLPHLQEARARSMRDKLSKAYSANTTTQNHVTKQRDEHQQQTPELARSQSSSRSTLSSPIHLVV